MKSKCIFIIVINYLIKFWDKLIRIKISITQTRYNFLLFREPKKVKVCRLPIRLGQKKSRVLTVEYILRSKIEYICVDSTSKFFSMGGHVNSKYSKYNRQPFHHKKSYSFVFQSYHYVLNPTQQAIMGNVLALIFSTLEINKYQNPLVLDSFKLIQYTIVLRLYNFEFFIIYSFKFNLISTC